MTEIQNFNLNYTAHPTVAKFHKSNAFVRGIKGPFGSGKSVGCCMELFAVAQEQAHAPDGLRHTRMGIFRNTYPELKSTTIKTWLEWFPEHVFGPIRWDSPITHRVQIGDIDMEVMFASADKDTDVKKLLSLELTMVWMNEAKEMPKAILDAATGRIGRYPPPILGGCTRSGIIMDTNPPDDMHWWYHLAEEELPKGYEFFNQPGGLIKQQNGKYRNNPKAENIENLPNKYEYYHRQVAGKDPMWISVYVLGQYGTVQAGMPVYRSSYNDQIHVAQDPLWPMKGRDIYMGWDFGRTPAVVIAQITPAGQLRVIDEVIGQDVGIRDFAEGYIQPLIRTKYKDFKVFSVGDPAGSQRSQIDSNTAFAELRALGFDIEAAPTNSIVKRLEAVRYWLSRMVDAQPAMIISPTCKMLRKGFLGGYRFRKLQISGAERYADKAEKNEFSHIHDATQYLCDHLREGRSYRPQVHVPSFTPADAVANY